MTCNNAVVPAALQVVNQAFTEIDATAPNNLDAMIAALAGSHLIIDARGFSMIERTICSDMSNVLPRYQPQANGSHLTYVAMGAIPVQMWFEGAPGQSNRAGYTANDVRNFIRKLGD
jgi:hypothetical protein